MFRFVDSGSCSDVHYLTQTGNVTCLKKLLQNKYNVCCHTHARARARAHVRTHTQVT